MVPAVEAPSLYGKQHTGNQQSTHRTADHGVMSQYPMKPTALLAILFTLLLLMPTHAADDLMKGITYKACNVPGKFIALTFDDGPHPANSPNLLNILKQHGAKATFFVIGKNAAEHPDLLKRMHAEGHEIANHSWSHPHLLSLEFPEVRNELERTNQAVASAIGQSPKVFRPPFIDTNPTLENWIFKQFGMRSIICSVDSEDWKGLDSATIRKNIVGGATPGGIILAHERNSTAMALADVLTDLKGQGYQFVTVSELIAMEKAGNSP